MKITNKRLLSCVVFLISAGAVFSQNFSIKLGKNEIGVNQYFTITVQVENDRLKQYSEFPDIDGFIKRGTSSSTTTNYINGRMSSTQSLTQNYQATEKGNFLLPPFFMTINGEEVKSEGTQIVVGEAVQRQSRRNSRGRDPFEDFFGSRNEPQEFLDVEADAFFALSVDKEEVYLGEGFTATLAFYVADANTAEMRFFDLPNQLTEMVKTIKPPGCWEENFSIDQISGDPVTIGGRSYSQYKIYQTVYYPLTLQDISFPSVGLKMIKFKVAKQQSFFGRNRQEDYETFYSKEKLVRVKDLPSHPLKDQVAVGNYRLDEEISANTLKTGQSFNYSFNIVGEGNISAIEPPVPDQQHAFDFYAPNVTQQINRASGRVTGVKKYDFYAIPNEPGNYNLSDYFSWIYFNPGTDKYDTLRSGYNLVVEGESRKNLSIASNDLGDFYDKINEVDNKLGSLKKDKWITNIVNLFISFTLIVSLNYMISFKELANKVLEMIMVSLKGVKSVVKSRKTLAFSLKNLPRRLFLELMETITRSTSFMGLVIGIIITFLLIVISTFTPYLLGALLGYLILFIVIPVIVYRISTYELKSHGLVSAGKMYIKVFWILLPYIVFPNVIESNVQAYRAYSDNPLPVLNDDLLGVLMMALFIHWYVFLNSIFYFMKKNGIAPYKAFIPFRNWILIGRVASYDLKWYRMLLPWPPFKLMAAIARHQKKNVFIGYFNAIIPIIFMPFLLYDKNNKIN